MTHDQVFGIYYKNKEKPESVTWLRELGIDQMITEHPEIAKAAAGCGMDVLFSADWDEAAYDDWPQLIERNLKESHGWERLDSIIMSDEPMYRDVKAKRECRGPQTFRKIASRVREEGWKQPLSISFLGPSTGWSVSQRSYFDGYFDSLDKVRLNLFPYIHSVPLGSISNWIDDVVQQMAPRRLPLTVTLQTWKYQEKTRLRRPLPPIEQLTVMSYLTLLSGAGLSFFDYNPEAWGPDYCKEFRQMMHGGLNNVEFSLTQLRDEIHGKQVVHYLDRYEIFHAEVVDKANSRSTYYSINTTGNPYDDGAKLDAYQIIRANEPIRPYPPRDPYPWDEDLGTPT